MPYAEVNFLYSNISYAGMQSRSRSRRSRHILVRSRSRSRRDGLLGAGIGAGAVKNGAAPAPKMDTIVEN